MNRPVWDLVAFVLGCTYLGAWIGYAFMSGELTLGKKILFLIYIATFVLIGWVMCDTWELVKGMFNI